MTRKEARRVVGNQPKWALRNQARALSMLTGINTPEQWHTLAALRTLGYKTAPIPKEYLT
jgi:hypothetical protein